MFLKEASALRFDVVLESGGVSLLVLFGCSLCSCSIKKLFGSLSVAEKDEGGRREKFGENSVGSFPE